MSKKTLAICTLAICAFIGLQAGDEEIPPSTPDEEKILACSKCQ